MRKFKGKIFYQLQIVSLLFCALLCNIKSNGQMISSIKSNRQSKIKCTDCKNGIVTWIQTTSCKNCESWADSYRNIKGCNVCKNNKVISKRRQDKCSTCNGTTWRVAFQPAPLNREQQIYKRINDLNLTPKRHIGTFRLNFEYTNYDILKYKIEYDYSENNLCYLLGAITVNEIPFSSCKDKVYALLDYFELMYNNTRKSDGWAGDILYYPSPDEAKSIRNELNQLSANPDYKPSFNFFVSTSELFMLY